MTVPLARDLVDYGMGVNTISPGAFLTPMLANLPKPLLEEVLRITPFPKRPGQAEEFAELALHICRNEFLNGSVIRLDGASDHGVSEALYLRDPDQNGVELYWDRPRDQWPLTPDGGLAMMTAPLDLAGLLREPPLEQSAPS